MTRPQKQGIALGTLAIAAVAWIASARELHDDPPPPTAANVAYGPHPRHRLDFYDAPGPGPHPLLVFIHGGGFVTGGKHEIDGRVIRWARDAGIAVAAINYRFVHANPYPAPMHDAARAVQFLRSKAPAWRLDPDRFAAYGGSAGAGIALWLAFHDDLADPASPDPVARQSTRLAAVGSWGGQSTYDPRAIRAWIGGRAWEHPSLLKLFGLAHIGQYDDPRFEPLFRDASPISHLSPDDPPVYLLYTEPDDPPPDFRPGLGIHHPRFGFELATRMQARAIASELMLAPATTDGNAHAPMFAFLRDRLNPPRPATAPLSVATHSP